MAIPDAAGLLARFRDGREGRDGAGGALFTFVAMSLSCSAPSPRRCAVVAMPCLAPPCLVTGARAACALAHCITTRQKRCELRRRTQRISHPPGQRLAGGRGVRLRRGRIRDGEFGSVVVDRDAAKAAEDV